MFAPAIRFWQHFLILQHLLPFIGTFEDVQDEVGAGVVVSSLCENPSLRGPLSHEWVSIALLFFFRLFFVFRIFVVVFVSAPASVSICTLSFSLSLSLSLGTSSRCLCISLYLLCASPLECLCKKETGIGLLRSRRPFSKTASVNLSYCITDDQHFSCSPRNLDASSLRPVHMQVKLWCSKSVKQQVYFLALTLCAP